MGAPPQRRGTEFQQARLTAPELPGSAPGELIAWATGVVQGHQVTMAIAGELARRLQHLLKAAGAETTPAGALSALRDCAANEDDDHFERFDLAFLQLQATVSLEEYEAIASAGLEVRCPVCRGEFLPDELLAHAADPDGQWRAHYGPGGNRVA